MSFLAIIYWLLSGLILAVCLFALWKGDRGVRWGAGVILGAILLERIGRMAFDPPAALSPVIGMAGDGLTALLLLTLAMRYASPWVGGAMLFYAVQFGFHAFYFVMHREPDVFRFVALSACFVGINVCLLGGAVAAWRRRREAETARPAPAA